MEGLGERLKQRAQDLGLNDSEVARRAGLSQARYQNYCSGRREPDLATLVRICRVLGTTPSVILGFADQPEMTSTEAQLRERISLSVDTLGAAKLRIAAALLDALAEVEDT